MTVSDSFTSPAADKKPIIPLFPNKKADDKISGKIIHIVHVVIYMSCESYLP